MGESESKAAEIAAANNLSTNSLITRFGLTPSTVRRNLLQEFNACRQNSTTGQEDDFINNTTDQGDEQSSFSGSISESDPIFSVISVRRNLQEFNAYRQNNTTGQEDDFINNTTDQGDEQSNSSDTESVPAYSVRRSLFGEFSRVCIPQNNFINSSITSDESFGYESPFTGNNGSYYDDYSY